MTGGGSAGREREPVNQADLCSVPARQPGSKNKVTYFCGTTTTTAAAIAEHAVGYWCVCVCTCVCVGRCMIRV